MVDLRCGIAIALVCGLVAAPAAMAATRIALVAPAGAEGDALASGAAEAAADAAADASEGAQVEVVRLGATSPWRDGAGAVAELLLAGDAIAVIGAPDGVTAHVAAQLATRLRLPFITSCPEAGLTQVRDPWILRAVPDDDEQLRLVAAVASGGRAVAAVPDGREGRERLAALERAAPDAGLAIDLVLHVDATGKVRARDGEGSPADRDVLLLWLDDAAALGLLEGAGPRGTPRRVLGSTRLDTHRFRAAAPKWLALDLPLLAPDDDVVAAGETGDVAARVGYDMVRSVIRAAEVSGGDPGALLRALRSAAPEKGRTGLFRFDENGNRMGRVPVVQLRSGAWRAADATVARVPRRSLDASTAPPNGELK